MQTAHDWALVDLASGNLPLLLLSSPEQPCHRNTELESSHLQQTLTCRNVGRNAWSHVSEVSNENHYGYALFASVDLEPLTCAQADSMTQVGIAIQTCKTARQSWVAYLCKVKLQVCCSLRCFFFLPNP